MTQLKTEKLIYKVDTEAEASNIIEEAINNQGQYDLKQHDAVHKMKKDKKTGDITEEYWICTIVKEYEVL